VINDPEFENLPIDAKHTMMIVCNSNANTFTMSNLASAYLTMILLRKGDSTNFQLYGSVATRIVAISDGVTPRSANINGIVEQRPMKTKPLRRPLKNRNDKIRNFPCANSSNI
jgi:hypothetical protein